MNNLRVVLKYLAHTMLVLYVAAFVLSSPFIRFKQSRWHAQAATLSRLQPPYEYLTQFARGNAPFDRKQLLYYRLFFTQLRSTLKDRPDAYGMLAFCEYHLGNTDKAIAAYKKAAERVPYFTWFNYNLAVIHFQRKDYVQAAKYASATARGNPDLVLRFMLTAKVYLDAMASVPNFEKDFSIRLKKSFQNSYKIMVLSYFKLGRFSEMVVLADIAVNQKLDDDGFFYYYLGMGAFQGKQYERAALYLREALARNPQSSEAYYFLALTLKAMGREDMAVPALQKAEIFNRTKGPSYQDIKHLSVQIF